MRSPFFATIAVALLCVTSSAAAQGAPELISFQGYVTDLGGNPVNNPGVSIRFRLTEGPTQVWRETQPSVEIVDGVFNVLLGSVIPLDTVAFNRPLVLKIKVGTDTEFTPFTPLTSAPYALGMRGLYAVKADNGSNQGYNVIGGAENNFVGSGVVGATIGGGGGFEGGNPVPNSVLADNGTVGGGIGNTVSRKNATIGGGRKNVASDGWATVAGGASNTASGGSATVGGGSSNNASGDVATIPGGLDNDARGFTSFAAGAGAKANHDATFVWNTSIVNPLASTAPNQFLIMAAGGVGIGTNAPMSQLEVNDGYVTVTNKGNGAILLHLNTDRGWVFRQHGTGADTKLELAGIGAGSNKSFIITTTGNVGIGTTSPSQKLHVNGNVLANAHTVPSDRRLKRNIQRISNSLHTVSRLSGVYYEWRTDEYPDRSFEEGRHIGFIAQDVEGVVPEAIRVAPDGTYSMRYQEIIPILVEAIKEQQLTIDEQRGVIAGLDDRLTTLEAAGTN